MATSTASGTSAHPSGGIDSANWKTAPFSFGLGWARADWLGVERAVGSIGLGCQNEQPPGHRLGRAKEPQPRLPQRGQCRPWHEVRRLGHEPKQRVEQRGQTLKISAEANLAFVIRGLGHRVHAREYKGG